jgi:hypothetical protein
MKKISLLLVAFLLTTICFAQIDKNLEKAFWKPATKRIIYGNTITRLKGNSDYSNEITNVGFRTFEQSGRLSLYITRPSRNAANTEWFTVIIKDEYGEVYFRKELESRSSEAIPAKGAFWWNFALISTPALYSGKYYIYIIDRRSEYSSYSNYICIFEINL